jgi:hypothetical protein
MDKDTQRRTPSTARHKFLATHFAVGFHGLMVRHLQAPPHDS